LGEFPLKCEVNMPAGRAIAGDDTCDSKLDGILGEVGIAEIGQDRLAAGQLKPQESHHLF
jgi:hypothetical protein